MNMSEEIIYTEEEIRQKIEAIYQEHPYLRDRKPTSDCHCCEWLDIREEFGPAAGHAWEELDTWRWLLGE
jgi:hypothetical protein